MVNENLGFSKKFIFLFITFFAICFETFATSPRVESIIIRNYSSKTVVITREYSDDPSKIFNAPETRSWTQNIQGINLSIRDLYLERSEISVKPNQEMTILRYEPFGSLDRWVRLDQIPFLEKVKSIYKLLRISTQDESKIITLENLGEQIIKKQMPADGIGALYIIEIFDYDIVGKPASEL